MNPELKAELLSAFDILMKDVEGRPSALFVAGGGHLDQNWEEVPSFGTPDVLYCGMSKMDYRAALVLVEGRPMVTIYHRVGDGTIQMRMVVDGIPYGSAFTFPDPWAQKPRGVSP